MNWVATTDSGVVIRVRVAPGASKDSVCGLMGDELKIRVQASPVDGKANKALTGFLAKMLGVAAREVEIVSGLRGRSKRVLVKGVGAGRVKRLADPGSSADRKVVSEDRRDQRRFRS